MNELLKKSAAEQSKALKNKEISAVELTNAAFDRIAELDEKLGAFNSLTKKLLWKQQKKLMKKLQKVKNYRCLPGFRLL